MSFPACAIHSAHLHRSLCSPPIHCRALQAWNAQRQLVLEEALNRSMLPALKAELRVRLIAEAREVVANRAGEELWRLASAPPLRVRI